MKLEKLTMLQIQQFYNELLKNGRVQKKNQPEMYLELTTGLRRGELLALRWEDLDVQNRTLSINKSVARQNGKRVISTPKTPNSIRTVLLS